MVEPHVPRLGGMHWLMSFIGCVGVRMENRGLVSWLQSAFASVPKKIDWQKVPNEYMRTKFCSHGVA